MKLQLALDHTSLEEALPLALKIANYVDIIELGTPLIKTAGLYGLMIMRICFPNHTIVADLKTMDAGEYEATPFLEAGADIVTVLGAADQNTIRGTITAARKFGKKAQVDLINVQNIGDAFVSLSVAGADIVGVHTGIDQQAMGQTPLDNLAILMEIKKRLEIDNTQISVAGGINLATLPAILNMRPDIIVVGGAITSAAYPDHIVSGMREMINNVLQ